MGIDTQAFFIVGSGRSGTQMMQKLLSTFENVEVHHEYLCAHVQPMAVRYYMGLAGLDEVCDHLRRIHGSAIHYSTCRLWGDSSNKLSWLVEALDLLYPNARFIHLVRDGRKVVSSFFHKLRSECYDDHSMAILQAHVDKPSANPAPPPEKKYWWNLPRPGSVLADEFRSYDQFERICFHWGECNRWILTNLACIEPERKRTFKLEDLVSDSISLQEMLGFLDLPYTDDHFAMIQRPHNVHVPQDHPLTERQLERLMDIAGDMMSFFEYDRTEEYRMVYDVAPVELRRRDQQV